MAMVAAVSTVAVATRSAGSPFMRARNSRPYCSRPAVFGGFVR